MLQQHIFRPADWLGDNGKSSGAPCGSSALSELSTPLKMLHSTAVHHARLEVYIPTNGKSICGGNKLCIQAWLQSLFDWQRPFKISSDS